MDIYNSNFDFNMYRAFYAVAEFNSFSKAAKALSVTQPAISYLIKKLEDTMDTTLFIRSNKKVLLTEEGSKLKFYIEMAFNNIITGYKVLKESKDVLSGEISIGIHSNIGTFFLPKYIKQFTNMNPDVKITIFSSRSAEMKEKLRNGSLDILIYRYPIGMDSNFIEQKLFSSESCFFTNKNYYDSFIQIKKQKLLVTFPLLLPMKGFVTSEVLEKVFKDNNMILSSNIYLYTTEMMISLVKEGVGIGWTLRDSIKEELKNGDLYEIPLDIDLPKFEYSVAYNTIFINNSAKKFIEFLLKKSVQ